VYHSVRGCVALRLELVARSDLARAQVAGKGIGIRCPDDLPPARGVHGIAAAADVDRLALSLAEADRLSLTLCEMH